MPKYLLEAKYTAEGLKGLKKEGATSRRKVIEHLVAGLNGRLEAFYYAFGDVDVYVIADLPDNVTAAAAASAVNLSGVVKLKTVPLMSTEEVDEAMKKIPNYRAPGA
jgi:uncharacterized protein with GYD domain